MAEGGGSGWRKRREGGGGGSVAGGSGWHGRGRGGGVEGGDGGPDGKADETRKEGTATGEDQEREEAPEKPLPASLPRPPPSAAVTNPAAMAAMTPEIAPLSEDYSGQTGGRAAGRASTGSGVSRRRRGFANREASLGCRFSAVKPKCAHLRGPASGTSGRARRRGGGTPGLADLLFGRNRFRSGGNGAS